MCKEYYWCDTCPTKHLQSDLRVIEYEKINRDAPNNLESCEVCFNCFEQLTEATTCSECFSDCPIDLEGMCQKCIDIIEDKES